MRENERKLNNDGFTLVELIVVILMMGIISLMLVMFLSESRKYYRIVNSDTQLQTEADFAMNYIGDLAIEASEIIFTTTLVTIQGSSGNTCTCDILTIIAPDTKAPSGTDMENYCYVIAHERETGILRYTRVKEADLPAGSELSEQYGNILGAGRLNESGMEIIGNKRAFLAQYVTNMEVTRHGSSDEITTIRLELEYDGRQYITVKTLSGRNGVH